MKRLEAKEDIPTNLELGFLDLTTYYADENLSSSFFEKILFFENERRPIRHLQNKNRFFMPLQEKALSFVATNDKSIIVAPTSFGKTLVLKEYIFRFDLRVVVFIVPTNSLAYELENSFKENPAFKKYETFDHWQNNKPERAAEYLLFVGTQEKYLEIADKLDHIDLFVIDEAYKLEESVTQQRAYRLAKTFLDSISAKSSKVCLLCPNAKLEGFEEYGFHTFETRFNAVDKVFHTIDGEDNFYATLNLEAGRAKTILYCDTPAEINECFDKIAQLPFNQNPLIKKLWQEVSVDFHPEWSVCKYLKKGVLVHHGQMPKYLQNKMLNLFLDKNLCNLIIGTNSISEGINTPTRNIFIYPKCQIEKHKMVVKNTIGRAGRLGEMPLGHIFSLTSMEDLANEDIQIILTLNKEGENDILSDTQSAEKRAEFAKKFDLKEDTVKILIEENHVSLQYLEHILSSLKKDVEKGWFSEMPLILSRADVGYEPWQSFRDTCYIRGVFQKSYRVMNKSSGMSTRFIISYKDRIDFFREKYKSKEENMSDSDIMDGYMKFIYSTLDYDLLIVANIAKTVENDKRDWVFGNNVMSAVNHFLKRYYKFAYGVQNFDSFSDEQKAVLHVLRELGVNLSEFDMSIGLIEQIVGELKIRYSGYDVINALRRLADSDSIYREKYIGIVNKYF